MIAPAIINQTARFMMGRATSNGNEAKSTMKHPSDMLTPRFEHGL